MITEPQLYFVMMRSRSAVARKFRQWIVNEVLPALHSKGYYAASRTPQKLTKPEETLLDNATMTQIRRYVNILSSNVWYKQSFSYAVWKAMRKATNTPSPQTFAVKDIDTVLKILKKARDFVASYYNFITDNEKKLFKKILLDGEPITELDKELSQFKLEEQNCKDFTTDWEDIADLLKIQVNLISYKK